MRVLIIVRDARVYIEIRPDESVELPLEICNRRRVVEKGTIVVAEWRETLEPLNKPVTIHDHVELCRGYLLRTEDGRIFVCARVYGVISVIGKAVVYLFQCD